MKKSSLILGLASALTVGQLSAALVSYYPLDDISGSDAVGGLDMTPVNLTASDIVPGVFGNAVSFSAVNQTMLQRVHSGTGSDVPVTSGSSFAVSMWVKADGTTQVTELGAAVGDRRFFSTGSTTDANPLFNLGTTNNASGGQVDYYGRNAGVGVAGAHVFSSTAPLDDEWHHILWNQTPASAELYVDGVKDGQTFPLVTFSGVVDTTTIGGILRATPSHWLTGAVDEVRLYDAALDSGEISALSAAAVPEPSSALLGVLGLVFFAFRRRR